MKRMRVLWILLVWVMCTSIVMAQDAVDMTFTGVGNWTDPNLWDVGSVPGSVQLASYANIMGPNTVCTVNTDTGAFAAGNQRMMVDDGATLVLEEGGILAACTWTRVGVSSIGTLAQTGGLFEVLNDKLGIGDKSGGQGYYIMSGGTLTYSGSRGDLGVGSRSGTGTFTVIGTTPVIMMEELIVCERDGAAGTVEFVLDANGVSPIVLSNVANIDSKGDTTTSALVVRATEVPPFEDIMLVETTSDANVAGVFDTVNGMPAAEGAEVVIICDGVSNTYMLTYAGGTGNDIVLQYVPPVAGLIVEDPDQLMGFEPQMLDRLESLGYAVEIIRGDDVKSGSFSVEAAEALDVIVVSEAISSSDVTSLAGANVPMMNGEGYGWHKMNYAESDGSANWQKPGGLVDVVNDTHPIVVNAGLNLGTMEYFLMDPNRDTTTASVASLAPGAVNLVSMTIDGTEYALIYAIDTGAELAKGAGPAANRIVGFSLPGNDTYSNVFSDDGWALFDAAIRWLDPAPLQIVAHWPMDEGTGTLVADIVGGNDGTMVGAEAWITDGALGGAVSFDESDPNAAIIVPHSEELDFGDVDFSISLMTRYLVVPGTDEHQLIMKGSFGAPDSGSRYTLFHKGDRMRFEIDNGPANVKSSLSLSDANFISGEWVHIVVVRDSVNDQLLMYADGELQGTAADTSGDISSGEEMRIGNSTTNGRTCVADLDDVRIFDEVLTVDEISRIY